MEPRGGLDRDAVVDQAARTAFTTSRASPSVRRKTSVLCIFQSEVEAIIQTRLPMCGQVLRRSVFLPEPVIWPHFLSSATISFSVAFTPKMSMSWRCSSSCFSNASRISSKILSLSVMDFLLAVFTAMRCACA